MKSTLTKIALAVGAVAALASAPAFAATATGYFNVTIKITPICTVATGSGQAGAITTDPPTLAGADLNFGSHASNETADVLATGNAASTNGIAVTCTKKTAYEIGLLPQNTGGDANGNGIMTALGLNGTNTDTVPYTLYKPNGVGGARTTNVWGNTTGTTGNTVMGTGSGSAQAYPVYGTVLGTNLNKMADRYQDRVLVTVTY